MRLHASRVACSAIRDHPLVILMGPAGCGKSTRLPKMLLEEDENHCVAVGEPRVAEEQGEPAGCKVGLFTGHERTPPEYQVGLVSFAVY